MLFRSAQTKKGYGMGEAGQGKMTTHQQKKLDRDALIEFRNRFQLPLSDEQTESLAFYRPDPDSDELRYLHERRAALGGYLPVRTSKAPNVPVPALGKWAEFAMQADGREISTTMAFVRMLVELEPVAAAGVPPGLLEKRYGISVQPVQVGEAAALQAALPDTHAWLEAASARHTSGDTARMAQRLLDDFRRGMLGSIALELP